LNFLKNQEIGDFFIPEKLKQRQRHMHDVNVFFYKKQEIGDFVIPEKLKIQPNDTEEVKAAKRKKVLLQYFNVIDILNPELFNIIDILNQTKPRGTKYSNNIS
jgi:hypothetical protein